MHKDGAVYARYVGDAYYRCAAPRVGAVHTCASLRACVFESLLGRGLCACVCLHARASQCGCCGVSRASRSQLVGRAALATLVPLTRVAVLDCCVCPPHVRAVCRVLPCEAGGRGLDVNPVGLTSTCAYALADPRVGVWGGQFATHAPPFEIARLGVCMRAVCWCSASRVAV